LIFLLRKKRRVGKLDPFRQARRQATFPELTRLREEARAARRERRNENARHAAGVSLQTGADG